MDEARRALVRVSAAISPGSALDVRAALADADGVADAAAVEEVVLQAYLFAGYPAALNAFRAWREVSGRPAPQAVPDEPDRWSRRGADVFRRVYRDHVERVREQVAGLHPDLERWALNEGYGKVLGREQLDLPTRELCIVALLAGLDAEPQLFAHMRGAINAGARAEEVEESIAIAAPGLAQGRADRVRDVWRRCMERRKTESGS